MTVPRNRENTNPVVLRQGMIIGNISAEADDDFLFDCFISNPALETCQKMQSPGMILAGRTGAGKTAILRYINRSQENAVAINPADMSMNYVSNSDALNFVQAIGADLDLLFQALWKHVLCIEFIRMRWLVENEEKSRNVFTRLWATVTKDARKQKALQYLQAWENKFWITMDMNVKEITEKVEGQLKADFGIEIEKFKAGGQYEKRLSREKKANLVARAKKIISPDQLVELNQIIDILSEQEAGSGMKNFYILIDDLDSKWVDASIRFRLINALIETIKSFRKIRNLKIIIALRSDNLERVIQETRDLSFQREKFEQYCVQLRWTKNELKQLLDKRINMLFKRQYTGADVNFDDLFTNNVGNMRPFDYILDRTLWRPRDLIAFVNACITVADGRDKVTADMIRRAEVEYSRIRADAIEQEWRSTFPTLNKILIFIESKRKPSLTVEELCKKNEIDSLALEIISPGQIDFDPLFNAAEAYYNSDGEKFKQLEFVKEIVGVLYRVGVVGVQLSGIYKFQYSHLDKPVISTSTIDFDTKLLIHRMLHGAFAIRSFD